VNRADEYQSAYGSRFRFLLDKFGQLADVKRQRIGHPARRFDSQFTPSGLGIRSQGDFHRDAVG
jgi:hypothetical protein